MSEPTDFTIADEVFVLPKGAVTPRFEAATEDDARMAVLMLNELLHAARLAAAFLNDPAARPLGALPAEADALADALIRLGLEVRA